jgi:hypothetical protein
LRHCGGIGLRLASDEAKSWRIENRAFPFDGPSAFGISGENAEPLNADRFFKDGKNVAVA